MSNQHEVVVIGSGTVGAAAAWRLAAHGARVVLLDRRGLDGVPPGPGAWPSSTQVVRLASKDELSVQMAIRALALWREVELVSGLQVVEPVDAVDHGPADVTVALHRTLDLSGLRATLVEPHEAQARWPGLRFDTSVLVHHGAGRVRSASARTALARAARACGAEVRAGAEAVALRELPGGAVEVQLADGARLRADSVVVAAGPGAPALLRPWSPPGTVWRLTRQHCFEVPAAAGGAAGAWPSVVHHGDVGAAPVRAVPGGGGLRFVEDTDEPADDPADTPAGGPPRGPGAPAAARVRDYVRRWCPGLDADRASTSSRVRAGTADRHVVVDRMGPFVALTGLRADAFGLAPAVGDLAAALTLDDVPAPREFAVPRPPGR